jgi:hypothetical protein
MLNNLHTVQPFQFQPGQNGALASPTHNPFMVALNPANPVFTETFGKNRPLARPMFMGYRENQAIYAGSRLFILT